MRGTARIDGGSVRLLAAGWFLAAAVDVSPAAAAAAEPVQPVVTGPASEFRDCPACPALIVIPAGQLRLKTFPVDDRGVPVPPFTGVHEIHVPFPFAIGRHEVTHAEFARFVADTRRTMPKGCQVYDAALDRVVHAPDADWRRPSAANVPGGERPPRDDDPVRCVTWYDATAYAEWLGARTGRHYRLPTVEEFQYAAQAGSTGTFAWGDDLDDACRYANVFDRSAGEHVQGTPPSADCTDGHVNVAPVGSFEPNAFGLHDTIGNVAEWLDDCFPNSLDHPDRGSPCYRRGSRGGSWLHPPIAYRPGFQSRGRPHVISAIFGFRVARDLP